MMERRARIVMLIILVFALGTGCSNLLIELNEAEERASSLSFGDQITLPSVTADGTPGDGVNAVILSDGLDLDGDGTVDLPFLEGGGGAASGRAAGGYSVDIDADGTADLFLTVDASGNVELTTDEDGTTAAAITTATVDGVVHMIGIDHAASDGTFDGVTDAASVFPLSAGATFSFDAVFASDGSAASAITATVVDIDGDGVIDGLDIYSDDGTITNDVPLVKTGTGVYSADVDGDGTPDFSVISVADIATGSGAVSVSVKDGDNNDVAVEVDGDGDPTGFATPDNAARLRFDFRRWFYDGLTVPFPQWDADAASVTTAGAEVVDLDGDGVIDGLDLDGTPGTAELALVPVDGNDGYLYSSDFDGDGTPDVYVSYSSDGTVLVTGEPVSPNADAATISGATVTIVTNADGSVAGIDTSTPPDGTVDTEALQPLHAGDTVGIAVATGATALPTTPTAIDTDGDGAVDGVDLDGDAETYELALWGPVEGTMGVYAADADGDGTADFYLIVRADGIEVNTSSDGGGNAVTAITTDSGALVGFDTDGDGNADVMTPTVNDDQTITVGESVHLPVSGGGSRLATTTTGTGPTGAEVTGFDLDGDPATVECTILNPDATDGRYQLDIDGNPENDPDAYVILDATGGVVLAQSSGAGTSDIAVIVAGNGDVVGVDTDGDGYPDIGLPGTIVIGSVLDLPTSGGGTIRGTVAVPDVTDDDGGDDVDWDIRFDPEAGGGTWRILDPLDGTGDYGVDISINGTPDVYLAADPIPEAPWEPAPILTTRSGGTGTSVTVTTDGGGTVTGLDTDGDGGTDVESADVITITYDANGATGGTAPDAQTKTEGIPIRLAANSGNLSRTGGEFEGWNTAADGSGTDYNLRSVYRGDTSVTLYAKWSGEALPATPENTVNATIDLGSEATITFSPVAPTVVQGTALTVSASAVTGATYAWYLNGTLQSGETSTGITVSTSSLDIGQYELMLVVNVGGTSTSERVYFTVTD